MKIAKRQTYQEKPAKPPMVILCEFNTFASKCGSLGAVPAMGQMRKHNARRVIATQAIMKFNSGKRVRFLGSARWEDTGESIKPVPKKFIPTQVVRKLRESAQDELAAEAQMLCMYN